MNPRTAIPFSIALAFAAGAGVVALLGAPPARSQVLATPSWIPLGVSQSGTTSTTWFHEPSSRQVLACQTSGSGTPPAIQCGTARLP